MIKLMNESIKPNKSQVIEASIDLLQTAKKSLSSIQKKLSKEKHEESDNLADAYDLITKALSNLEGSKVLTESSSITKSDESTVINEATDEFDPKKFLSKLIVRYQDIDAAFSDLSKKGLLPDGSKVNRSKGRLEVKGYAFKPVIKLGKNASPENAVATGEWTYSKLKESMNESAERIEAVLPISRSMLRELASKFDGTISNRGNAVDFNGNSKNLAKAIKYLRSTNQKDIPLIIISNAFDTGYQVSPLNYNLNEKESVELTEATSSKAKLGKKVKQLKGWSIYQGTNDEGEETFRCFTPDERPGVGYEDWECDTLEQAIEWIKNY